MHYPFQLMKQSFLIKSFIVLACGFPKQNLYIFLKNTLKCLFYIDMFI